MAAHKTTATPAATTSDKAPKAKVVPICKCGCGEHTKGGQFRPGHDARYHAAQRAAGHAPTYKLSAEIRAKRAKAIRDHRAAAKVIEVVVTPTPVAVPDSTPTVRRVRSTKTGA